MTAPLPLCINQKCLHSERHHDWEAYDGKGIPQSSDYVCSIPNCTCRLDMRSALINFAVKYPGALNISEVRR